MLLLCFLFLASSMGEGGSEEEEEEKKNFFLSCEKNSLFLFFPFPRRLSLSFFLFLAMNALALRSPGLMALRYVSYQLASTFVY